MARVDAAMINFTQALQGIEKGLQEKRVEATLVHARWLRVAAEDAALKIEPQTNGELSYLFYEYLEKTREGSTAIIDLANAGDWLGVGQEVEGIRHNCISCHVRFANDTYGFYPAQQNLLVGEIEILKLSGEKRDNRSNVVAFLEGGAEKTLYPLPRENPVFSQKNCSFTPRVLPVVKGTTVDFPNDDTVFHNVFSLSRTRFFDLDIYRTKESKSITFPRAGWVKVYCNIHPNMIAHIIVLENPFFALSDKRGVFVISEVPDGKYTLRLWHDFGQGSQREIELSGGSLHRYYLTLEEDRKFVQHRNKFGHRYKQGYGR